jgi:hypothetical protein
VITSPDFRTIRLTQYFMNTVGFFFAERLSSETNALGAECAARSTIRDKRVRSL